MSLNRQVEIRLIDILAYIIRKAVIIIIGALAGIVVFFGAHVLLNNTVEKNAEFQLNLERYNNSLDSKRIELDYLQKTYSSKKEKYESSEMLSLVNGGSIYKSSISFFIMPMENETAKNNTLTKKSEMYLIIAPFLVSDGWDEQEMDGSTLFYKENMIISFSDGFFDLKSFSNTIQDSESKIRDQFSIIISRVKDLRYYLVSKTENPVEEYSGTEIIEIVRSQKKELTDLESEIEKSENELRELEKNYPSKTRPLFASISGFLIGGILTTGILILHFLSSLLVSSSFCFERSTDFYFLGSCFEGKPIFAKIARLIIGEREPDNKINEREQILNNIKSSLSDLDKGKKIVVLSSYNKKIESCSETVCSIVSECGYEPVLVANSLKNPKMMKDIQEADAVILVEKQWGSRWAFVLSTIDSVERLERRIIGFVLF